MSSSASARLTLPLGAPCSWDSIADTLLWRGGYAEASGAPGSRSSCCSASTPAGCRDDHWLNDPEDGGGRLLGEGCHFVDFACWFAGELPVRVSCMLRPDAGQPLAAAQSFSLTLDFADGSLATVLYSARGASGLAKEYVEAHSGGRSGVLTDFRSLTLFDGRKRSVTRGRSIDKGHKAQFAHLRAARRRSGRIRVALRTRHDGCHA